MGYAVFDRIKETTTTTGTGTVTLAGAVLGFSTFSSRLATNDTVSYCIQGAVNEWEVGWGKLASSSTITRETVLASSNSDALVSLSAGTKEIFFTVLASQLRPGVDYAIGAGIFTF